MRIERSFLPLLGIVMSKGGFFMEKKGELVLAERKQLMVEAVECVEEFDERKIVLKTALGDLEILGNGLSVVALDLENGKIEVEGLVNSLKYQDAKGDKARKKSKSILAKMVK